MEASQNPFDMGAAAPAAGAGALDAGLFAAPAGDSQAPATGAGAPADDCTFLNVTNDLFIGCPSIKNALFAFSSER